jgi:putative FmdB family regulatory protein
MPFYEYQCSVCQHHTEVLQKISDGPLRKCPECGKQALKRLISAPVFRLKGGGWYETDFKSDGEQKRNLAGSEEAAESKPETKSEDSKATTDAKPAEKAQTKPAESKPAEKASSSSSKSAAKLAQKPAVKPKPKAKPVKALAKKKSARR